MAEANLALKYRPARFADVTGHDTVVQIVKSLADRNREIRVVLLAGQRGVGKTTLARLLAKRLNCENPGTDVCGKCKSCRAMDGSRHPDYIEQDMGSKGGKDDVRRLQEEALNRPTWSYKVFALDEVHGASPQAFNAMLRLLEEPPETSYFVLCTTELQQVPFVIASRALTLELEALPPPAVKLCLERVTRAEGIEAERGVLELISENCDGSARDALMILTRLRLAGNGAISLELLKGEPWYRATRGVEELIRGLAFNDKKQFDAATADLVSRLDYITLLRAAVRRLSLWHMEKGKRPGKVLESIWRAYLRSRAGAEPELVMATLWATVRGEERGI